MVKSQRYACRVSTLAMSVLLLPLVCGPARAQAEPDRSILPIVPQPFGGKIGATAADSTPQFPAKPRPPKGAPNVLLVMTDDVGFGASSTFGGLIATPNLDRLARNGLRYNNFHTAAMCSPSRAALLTGRNHHAVGMGPLPDFATGYPGYLGEISKDAATVAEVLKDNGYNTAMFGKHHDVPLSELSTNGDFQNWPTSLGFEHFFGFIGSQTDQWRPALLRDTQRAVYAPGDHLEKMLADDAIAWLHNQKAADPDRPFFIYYAPGTAHAPLQAPKDWIARFKGKFDQGWDAAREQILRQQKAAGVAPANTTLTPRPDFIPAWSSLDARQKQVAAHLMEVYAGQLAYQDNQFGRLLDELTRMGQIDNTLIIFVEGDNGASPEGGVNGTTNDTGTLVNRAPESEDWLVDSLDRMGGPDAHAHYPIGWAWAMDTPFRYFKRIASHLGGIRNGMVLSWPQAIREVGGVRPQFSHLIDVAPTILEAAGLPQPKQVNGVAQQPMEGASLQYSFPSAKVAERPRTQYFELLGNRALYKDGWMASTTPPPAALEMAVNPGQHVAPEDYAWELYNLREDFSQSRDLAARNPEKLAQLRQEWDAQARQNKVYPLDNALTPARVTAEARARVPDRASYVYWGTGVDLERGNMPPIFRKSYRLTASVDIPSGGGEGVLAAVGDRFAGWSFYLKGGVPMVAEAYSDQPQHHFRLAADKAVPPGPAQISYDVTYVPDSQAVDVAIAVDGAPVGSARFPNRVFMVDQGESFAIGRDLYAPVTDDYKDNGVFNGTIAKVAIDVRQ